MLWFYADIVPNQKCNFQQLPVLGWSRGETHHCHSSMPMKKTSFLCDRDMKTKTTCIRWAALGSPSQEGNQVVLVAPSEVALPNSPLLRLMRKHRPRWGLGAPSAQVEVEMEMVQGQPALFLLSSSASDCCWFIITIGWDPTSVGLPAPVGIDHPLQERDVPIVNVLGLSDTLGDLACRRCCEEVTDARESAVSLLNGIERSLVGTCDVVAANFPDVISKVKGSLHALQLALDSSPDAQQVIVCFHLCGTFVQHSRCHEHRLQMDDCGCPFKRQVIPHRHPVL